MHLSGAIILRFPLQKESTIDGEEILAFDQMVIQYEIQALCFESSFWGLRFRNLPVMQMSLSNSLNAIRRIKEYLRWDRLEFMPYKEHNTWNMFCRTVWIVSCRQGMLGHGVRISRKFYNTEDYILMMNQWQLTIVETSSEFQATQKATLFIWPLMIPGLVWNTWDPANRERKSRWYKGVAVLWSHSRNLSLQSSVHCSLHSSSIISGIACQKIDLAHEVDGSWWNPKHQNSLTSIIVAHSTNGCTHHCNKLVGSDSLGVHVKHLI